MYCILKDQLLRYLRGPVLPDFLGRRLGMCVLVSGWQVRAEFTKDN